jgi:hypothetical protein
MCGYWFFPHSVSFTSVIDGRNELAFSVKWLNKGVAPAYNPYSLWVKMESKDNQYTMMISESDTRDWLPGQIIQESYALELPAEVESGEYLIKIKMTTGTDDRQTVKLGLKEQLLNKDGFYELFSIQIKKIE